MDNRSIAQLFAETADLLEITQRGLGKTNLYRLFLTVKKGSNRRP